MAKRVKRGRGVSTYASLYSNQDQDGGDSFGSHCNEQQDEEQKSEVDAGDDARVVKRTKRMTSLRSDSSGEGEKTRKRKKMRVVKKGSKDDAASWWCSIEANPHCMQSEKTDLRAPHPIQRVLAANATRRAYRPRGGGYKSVQHWGQRKLLLSEIEFLTMYSDRDRPLVYAGAAPGTHMPVLAKMFPTQKFILVDPNDFDVVETDRITIIQDFFTDELCKKYKDQNVLFVSDIRTGMPLKQSSREVEARVKEDMDAQMRWHQALNPYRSMLKFRLPYFPGKTNYVDGFVWLPLWGRVQTTESRLVVAKDAPIKEWDNTEYEEKLYHFNTVSRVCAYPHDVDGEGMDHCYDCSAEVAVLKEYLLRYSSLWLKDCSATDQRIMLGVEDQVAELLAREDAEGEAAPGTPCKPPIQVWEKITLTDQQEQLVSAAIAEVSASLSRELSDRRTLGSKYMPTEERGYQFKSNVETKLKPVSKELLDFAEDMPENFNGWKNGRWTVDQERVE